MKKHLETIFLTLRGVLLATITAAMIFGPATAMAAVNTATWDIGGVAQSPDATFTLNSYDNTQISLTKTASLVSDGSELTSGDSVPTGTPVDFMIIVSNENTNPVSNINIVDVLDDTIFTYVPGNMRINATNTCADLVCTAAERADLYNFATAINDIIDGDVGGYEANTPAAGSTRVSAGSGTGNSALNVVGATAIPTAGEDFALIYRVTVQ